MGPIVNVGLTYRALKRQALKSSVYLHTVARHTLEVIMRQLSGICFKFLFKFKMLYVFQKLIFLFKLKYTCLFSHSHAHTYFIFFLRMPYEPFIIDLFLSFERISAHTVKKQLSVGFILFMQKCVGEEDLTRL